MHESAVEIAAQPGRAVSLRLDRQGVGGYLWSIGEMPPGLSLDGEPEQETGGDVGGGATLVVRLIAEHVGRYVFACELRRPWGGGEPVERRSVTVAAG